MKQMLIILLTIVIRCAAGTSGTVGIVQWYPNLAVTDSAQATVMTPGIVRMDTLGVSIGDTLIKIERYRGINITTSVRTIGSLCDYLASEYVAVNDDLQMIEDEYKQLLERRASALEYKAYIINWYKLIKETWTVDCQKR